MKNTIESAATTEMTGSTDDQTPEDRRTEQTSRGNDCTGEASRTGMPDHTAQTLVELHLGDVAAGQLRSDRMAELVDPHAEQRKWIEDLASMGDAGQQHAEGCCGPEGCHQVIAIQTWRCL